MCVVHRYGSNDSRDWSGMIEVKRSPFGGWEWYVRVRDVVVGTGTAPSDEMAWDTAQDCVDEYVRGLQE